MHRSFDWLIDWSVGRSVDRLIDGWIDWLIVDLPFFVILDQCHGRKFKIQSYSTWNFWQPQGKASAGAPWWTGKRGTSHRMFKYCYCWFADTLKLSFQFSLCFTDCSEHEFRLAAIAPRTGSGPAEREEKSRQGGAASPHFAHSAGQKVWETAASSTQ